MSSSVTFDHYTSAKYGAALRVLPESDLTIPELVEDTRVFDKKRYSEEIHSPHVLFPTAKLQAPLPRCLDMPIRLKGESLYCIPQEWVSLLPIISKIASFEHIHNPNVIKDYYTYITVDCSEVKAGETQRHEGLHVDGFQGARIEEKTKITRNYVATSNGGTKFFPQLFNADYDESQYNIFRGFDRQAKDPIVAPENKVVFMDAYTVHESGAAARDGLRFFFRMTYDYKEFDRLGNTKNAMLYYDWDMVERDVQSTLVDPPL